MSIYEAESWNGNNLIIWKIQQWIQHQATQIAHTTKALVCGVNYQGIYVRTG